MQLQKISEQNFLYMVRKKSCRKEKFGMS